MCVVQLCQVEQLVLDRFRAILALNEVRSCCSQSVTMENVCDTIDLTISKMSVVCALRSSRQSECLKFLELHLLLAFGGAVAVQSDPVARLIFILHQKRICTGESR